MSTQKKSLEFALELEKKGHAYYEKHAKTVENPLTKKVLKSLSSQELDHLEKIKKICAGEGVVKDRDDSFDIEAEVKEIFENFSAKEKKGWKEDNIEIYEHAMELEKEIYKAYEKLADEADKPQEKEFFMALMQEEDKHYESLENVYYYFSNPGDWFAQEESKVWNWMNI